MKRSVIVLTLLLFTALGHVAILYARDAAATQNAPTADLDIPSRIGPYRQYGDDIDPGDKVRAVLQTSEILQRVYTSSAGKPVQMTLVHAGTTRRSLHHPEICLVGQGWEIREQYADPVGISFMGKRLILFKGEQEEAVLYWLKTGDRFMSSSFLNAWYWACGQLFFNSPTSTMIRVSTPIGRGREEPAFQLLEDFASLLGPILLTHID